MTWSAVTALVAAACSHNGYVLTMTRPSIIASPTVALIASDDAPMSKIKAGFTYMGWYRFFNLDPTVIQRSFALQVDGDALFFVPIGGVHGGWEFDKDGPPVVGPLGESARDWHHYAVSWDQATGNRRVYIDGAQVYADRSGRGSDLSAATSPLFHVGIACTPRDTYLVDGRETGDLVDYMDEYIDCDDYSLHGQLDDMALFGGALSETQISERWNASLTDRLAGGLEPDLLLLYNFNSPHASPDVEPNLGHGGSTYDLMLGAIPSESEVFRRRFRDSERDVVKRFAAPDRTPADTAGVGWVKAEDSGAPLVVTAEAGESITIALDGNGANHSYTAPDPFDATDVLALTDGSGAPISVHVVPRRSPTAMPTPASIYGNVLTIEDRPVAILLHSASTAGEPTEVIIEALPKLGRLFEVADSTQLDDRSTPIRAVGHSISARQRAPHVVYVPPRNRFGEDLDSFKYRARLERHVHLISELSTVVISVEEVNDIPVVRGANSTVDEDDSAGVVIFLNSTDAEEGRPHDIFITSLPAHGTLYRMPSNEPITREYEIYYIGNVVGQYLSRIVGASSFWGGPPSASYHPIMALGPPDCNTMGECESHGPWVDDASLAVPVGAKVVHPSGGLLAYVVGSTSDTVSIEYAQMYRNGSDGVIVQCHMQPDSALRYPEDCLDVSGVVTATVPRADIAPVDAGVWSPRYQGYVGDLRMTDPTSIAFGAQFQMDHNQADTYDSLGYTEYLEAEIDEPVYFAAVEIGSSKGYGAVVGIKVQALDGSWMRLYKGAARHADFALNSRRGRYLLWAPKICRPHFKTKRVRIELDTSEETGIDEWNYIDAIRIVGMRELQPAALLTGEDHVRYVPHANAHGDDEFHFASSDCPGDAFRSSRTGVMTVRIAPVNDAPIIEEREIELDGYAEDDLEVEIAASDVDDNDDELHIVISTRPSFGTLRDSDGHAIDEDDQELPAGSMKLLFSASGPDVINATGATQDDEGEYTARTEFEYQVRDPGGRRARGRVVLTMRHTPRQPDEEPEDLTPMIAGAGAGFVCLLCCAAGLMLYYKRRLDLAAKLANAKLPDNVQEVMEEIYSTVVDQDGGETAQYIPELATADPKRFGIVLCDLEGRMYEVGDTRDAFSIQSTCKPLLYCLAIQEQGLPAVEAKIGDEPSGQPFNALNIDPNNRAFNPYVNAGAMVSMSLISGETAEERYTKFVDLAAQMSSPDSTHEIDMNVFASEMATNEGNRAIATELVRREIVSGDADLVVEAYTRACSLNTCAYDAAVMGATLANNGLNPFTGAQTVASEVAQQTVTVMMSCGMYNGAGKWIVDVGIPAKSGVAGLLMCVVPGVCGIGIFSPCLDHNGNSTRGVLVAKAMSEALGLHVLKSKTNDGAAGQRAASTHGSNGRSTGGRQSKHSKVSAPSPPPSDRGSAASTPSRSQHQRGWGSTLLPPPQSQPRGPAHQQQQQASSSARVVPEASAPGDWTVSDEV